MTNKLVSRTRQRGLSIVGLLFVGIIVAVTFVVAAQVLPTAIEYQAVVKAVNKASAGTTMAEVRAIFDRAAEIDDISSISGKDLDISKISGKIVVAFSYEREIHLAGPAYLLLKYNGRSN